jgi:hypothetical protein
MEMKMPAWFKVASGLTLENGSESEKQHNSRQINAPHNTTKLNKAKQTD